MSEGSCCTIPFFLIEGVAVRYRVMRNGRRQVFDFLLPGDFAGLHSCFFRSALYSIKTLTSSVIGQVPRAQLVDLFSNQPRLMAKLLWSFSCKSTIYSEHLISIARRSAPERIAHFLLELQTRLEERGLADKRSYIFPLTQELISDALGLTGPYVNCVLRQLRTAGLVSIRDKKIVIEKYQELSALADFDSTYLKPRFARTPLSWTASIIEGSKETPNNTV